MEAALIKPLVAAILAKAQAYRWTLQGLGMLRLYLSENQRLHVWSRAHAAPGVSELHDHPWHFRSRIVAGRLMNQRYTATPSAGGGHWCQTLKCGAGGCLASAPPVRVELEGDPLEDYGEGEEYHQGHNEIHQSMPEDGTVTIIARHFRTDRDHARVFWPVGSEWGSAEPRDATPEEVRSITTNALRRWFE
jgi:hypothetical protein